MLNVSVAAHERPGTGQADARTNGRQVFASKGADNLTNTPGKGRRPQGMELESAMTQHLGHPSQPWAGLQTRLHVVPHLVSRGGQDDQARRDLAAVSLVLGYLARKRDTADAG